MKKMSRKLRLSKETVKTLAPAHLELVAGGAYTGGSATTRISNAPALSCAAPC